MLVYFVLFLATLSLALTKDAPIVPVEPFQPKPIHYTIDDLPPPYNTSSASKPAIVVPVPKNATLFVPNTKFRVTIYRDGLQAPRHMIYTPTGEILVTEARGSQITILNGDQTAECHFTSFWHGFYSRLVLCGKCRQSPSISIYDW